MRTTLHVPTLKLPTIAPGGLIVRRMRYVWRRLLRVHATPHDIALGCAAGVFAACTPFLGLQTALAILLAFAFRVNIPAAMIGTFAGNPLSWPAIWSFSYLSGAWLLGVDPVKAADEVSRSAEAIAEVAAHPSPVAIDVVATTLAPHVMPLMTGSLIVGVIAAALSYYPTRRAVRRFQQRRQAALFAALG